MDRRDATFLAYEYVTGGLMPIKCTNCGKRYEADIESACPRCLTSPYGTSPVSTAQRPSPVARQSRGDDGAASKPPSHASDVPWQRLIDAQLYTGTYLRAIFLLAIAGVIGSVTGAASALIQQDAYAACVRDGYRCNDGVGPAVLVIGGFMSLAFVVAAIAAAVAGNSYRRRAGA
jgi:hypothetical protein